MKKKILLFRSFLSACLFLFFLNAFSQSFNVATYNLRYANHDDSVNDNGWGHRYPVICRMVLFHQFDIFGTQEGLYGMLEDLRRNLPGYAYIGIGRDDGQKAGEHSAIFYNTAKFSLLSHGDFWLSQQTDRPNKGWDAVLPRICSWGRFKEKSTGFIFYFFNLHMDHIGVEARRESAKLILTRIRQLPANTPIILTGDFNVDQTSESYHLLNTSGVLRDAYDITKMRYAETGTFNDFDPNTKTNSRIDHIFLSHIFSVNRYAILLDSYRSDLPGGSALRLPSDHYPVMAGISVTSK